MQLKLCAIFLSQHTKINNFSQLLSSLAAIGLLVMAATNKVSLAFILALLVVILLGIYETILAIRVGFDVEILNQLSLKEQVSSEDLEFLDRSLVDIGLVKKLDGNPTTRDLNTRLQACLKLFKYQALMLIVQLAILLIMSLSKIVLLL